MYYVNVRGEQLPIGKKRRKFKTVNIRSVFLQLPIVSRLLSNHHTCKLPLENISCFASIKSTVFTSSTEYKSMSIKTFSLDKIAELGLLQISQRRSRVTVVQNQEMIVEK